MREEEVDAEAIVGVDYGPALAGLNFFEAGFSKTVRL
jgi:hypothetical protein